MAKWSPDKSLTKEFSDFRLRYAILPLVMKNTIGIPCNRSRMAQDKTIMPWLQGALFQAGVSKVQEIQILC